MTEDNYCQQCRTELPANAPGGVCPKCIMKLGLTTEVAPEKVHAAEGQNGGPTTAASPTGFVPPEPQVLDQKFPQLEVLEVLGQGGMGAVYKARQKQLDRIVALKILPSEVGKDPAFAERFAREARSLAKLNHPHIVTLYEFGQSSDGLYYFIMDFVDGIDLRQVIQAGDLSTDEVLALVPQICEALHYAHHEGVIHRDIKPENILLDTRGYVKIGDFGLAKLMDIPATAYTLTQSQQRVGTPHYMAPEQVEGAQQIDHWADIYSLGVVFYEMLTGKLPLGRFPLPSQKVRVDLRLDDVVLRTLEKEPERRYQNISEVKTAVETIASSPEAAPPSTVSDESAQAVSQRLRIPAIGLMISGAVNFLSLALVLVLNFAMVWLDTPGRLGVLVVAVMAAATAVGTILIIGAWQMLRLRSFSWAVAGSVLALVPLSAGFMLSVPMGIWALFVLKRPDVQMAFADKKQEELGKVKHPSGTLFGIGFPEHLKILAYIRIGIGSLFLVGALAIFLIMAMPGIASGVRKDMAILSAFGLAFAVFPLALAVPNLVGAAGLIKRRPWARILVLIVSTMDLFAFPVGTIIGIYTIWVLVQKETVELFAHTSTRVRI